MTRPASPLATTNWAGRTLRGLSWGLLYSAAFAFLNWLAWQAGCRTNRMTGLELERSTILGAVLMFAIGLTTAATVIAFAKPFCKSWLRCSVVSFAALLLPASVLDQIIGIGGPAVQIKQAVFDGIKLAILVAPFAGWALWQLAKQGSEWYWPYRGPLS